MSSRPVAKKRKPRVPVPESKKDEAYWRFRKRNTQLARDYRRRKKEELIQKKEYLKRLLEKKKELQEKENELYKKLLEINLEVMDLGIPVDLYLQEDQFDL